MQYLHNSVIQSHGWLNSYNCVIDNRWILKITDFGINKFRESESIKNNEYNINDLLWVAPELLRNETNFNKGSQEADVYSFAIIMQEVIVRGKPFCCFTQLTTKEIIDKLKNPPPIIRPLVETECASNDMIRIMSECWQENPTARPSFDQIYDEFQKFFGERYKILKLISTSINIHILSAQVFQVLY
jgi:serine/threonine protein kinase